MTGRIRHITFDCTDPLALAAFWRDVLGFIDDPENPNEPDDPEALLIDPKGLHPGLLFIAVPEPKQVKNRVHLDLTPDTTRDEEVERLLGIGATLVADHRDPDGPGWVVLADPEGNEVCIERNPSERGAPTGPAWTDERPMLHGLRTGGEREMLEAMLEWYRAGVVGKVRGLAQHKAVARPGASETSIAGLLNHLAMVDDHWFRVRFAGGDPHPDFAHVDWEADPDYEFRTARDTPIEDLVARYEAACEASRQAAADRDLEEIGVDTSYQTFSLRYVYLHMIDETARHLGHMDILRELLDGTTGD